MSRYTAIHHSKNQISFIIHINECVLMHRVTLCSTGKISFKSMLASRIGIDWVCGANDTISVLRGHQADGAMRWECMVGWTRHGFISTESDAVAVVWQRLRALAHWGSVLVLNGGIGFRSISVAMFIIGTGLKAPTHLKNSPRSLWWPCKPPGGCSGSNIETLRSRQRTCHTTTTVYDG